MAKPGKRVNIKMRSTESAYTYMTTKNKQNTPGRIQIKKYDPTPSVRKHVLFKEAK